ncbi:protein FAM177A1 isoform X2 [Antennarius striatus]|uniref:protein FAM177A1 isoform X2 n=1 Tax=Antennarius striatus TaxID=241820 RepID=UPI0035B3ADD3
MSSLPVFMTNVNVSLGQTIEMEKSVGAGDSSQGIEMEDFSRKRVREKVPRRTIFFASGETMEEYSTDEEEEEEALKTDVITVDSSKLTWGPYVWFQMWRMATSTVSVCDYMGEKLASLFGITTPKYQYAIDEYHRMKKEEEEEEEENRLAEAAERRFAEQDDQDSAAVEQPEASGAPFVNISIDVEPDHHLSAPDANRVPSSIPS